MKQNLRRKSVVYSLSPFKIFELQKIIKIEDKMMINNLRNKYNKELNTIE